MTGVLVLLMAFQTSPELRQHIEAGMKAKAHGDTAGAVREFTRVTEIAPNLAAGHVNLGAAQLAAKDYRAAVVALRRSLELNRDLPGAHSLLGTALLVQGFGCEAIPHLEKGDAQELLAVALLDCDRPREALERLEAALEKRPDDPDLLFYLGQAHNALARKSFEKLRVTHPESARTQQMLGEALVASGNTAGAEQRFRKALEARPDLPGVHFALGELFVQAGDFRKAEAEFRAEADRSPGSAAAAYKLGWVLANQGRTENAIEELRRADQLKPDMPETLLELGKLLNSSGDPKSAEVYLRKVLVIEQETKLAETAHFQLAQVYRKLGRPADADKEMKRFTELRTRLAAR